MIAPVPKRTLLPPLSAEARADLLARYDAAPDPEARTRYQMVLLAVEQGRTTYQIAPLVHRSHDVVMRVLQRFRDHGPAAVPRKKGAGPKPKITPAWEAELLRVIEDDPRRHGVDSANWTTQLLADYLARATGIATNQETVRRALHRHDYVCKRPTWTVAHKAAEREEWVGKGSGGRSS
jgi:transposase